MGKIKSRINLNHRLTQIGTDNSELRMRNAEVKNEDGKWRMKRRTVTSASDQLPVQVTGNRQLFSAHESRLTMHNLKSSILNIFRILESGGLTPRRSAPIILLLILALFSFSCGKKPLEPNLSTDPFATSQNNYLIQDFGAYVSPGQITLNWKASSEGKELGYVLYRRSLTTEEWQGPINGSSLLKTTSYTDAGLSENKNYYYRILCYNSNASFITNAIAPKIRAASAITLDGDSADWSSLPPSYVTVTEYNGDAQYTTNPAALYSIYLTSDANYLYAAIPTTDNTWGADVEYWFAIEGNPSNAASAPPNPKGWGHSGTTFNGWHPSYVVIFKNKANQAGVTEAWETHWQSDTKAFTSQAGLPSNDWDFGKTEQWLEFRIPLTTIDSSVGDDIKILLWTSQQDKPGAHWSIPVDANINLYGDNSTDFKSYLTYTLGN